MSSPLISVVMAVYNNMPFLPMAVESILRQSFTDFEFIIIDDGSIDGGGEWLEEAARRDGRIRLVRRGNIGLTKSLNEGCALARGEFIARMDGDDIAYSQRFQIQIDKLLKNKNLVALGAQVRYIDKNNTPLFIRSVPIENEAIEKCHLAAWGGVVIHPVVMMRRNALSSIRGYDENFPRAQDYDLWFRLGNIGLIENLPNVLLDYRRHSNAVGLGSKKNQSDAVKIILNRELAKRGLDKPLLMPQEFQIFPDDLQWLAKKSAQDGFLKTAFISNGRLLYKSLVNLFNFVCNILTAITSFFQKN